MPAAVVGLMGTMYAASSAKQASADAADKMAQGTTASLRQQERFLILLKNI